MSKFKVGDKVRCVAGVDCFTANHGADCGVVSFVNSNGTFINIDGHELSWNINKFELVQDEWTIYNNDKPLNELSDELRGLLLNYLFSNGEVQIFSCKAWLDMSLGFNLINRESIYRAKQKSERELFIDAFIDINFSASREQIIDKLFYKGFKWPKGGE